MFILIAELGKASSFWRPSNASKCDQRVRICLCIPSWCCQCSASQGACATVNKSLSKIIFTRVKVKTSLRRLPLLADAVLSKLSMDHSDRASWEQVLSILSNVVAECNEGARAAAQEAEMEALARCDVFFLLLINIFSSLFYLKCVSSSV